MITYRIEELNLMEIDLQYHKSMKYVKVYKYYILKNISILSKIILNEEFMV